MAHCTSCSSSTSCSSCTGAFYPNGNQCSPCNSACTACTGSLISECSACAGTYYLTGTTCKGKALLHAVLTQMSVCSVFHMQRLQLSGLGLLNNSRCRLCLYAAIAI